MPRSAFRRTPLAAAVLAALSVPVQASLLDDATPVLTLRTLPEGYRFSSFDVAALPDAQVAVVWTEHHSGLTDPDLLVLQRFDNDGAPVGEALTLFEEQANTSSLSQARIAADEQGNMVVAWNHQEGGSLSTGCSGIVQFVRISADGNISTTSSPDAGASGGLCHPAVAMDADGDFAVLWLDDNSVPTHYLRTFQANGNTLAGPILVATPNGNTPAALAMQRDGTLMTAWRTNSILQGRRISLNGTSLGAAARLDGSELTASLIQQNPALAADRDGGFAALWSEFNPNADTEDMEVTVRGQRWQADGTAGDAFLLANMANNGSDYFSAPGLGADSEGNLATAWVLMTPHSPDTPQATALDADSEVIGEPQTAWTDGITGDSDLSTPRLAMSDEVIALAWTHRTEYGEPEQLHLRLAPPLADPATIPPPATGGGGGGGGASWLFWPLAALGLLRRRTHR